MQAELLGEVDVHEAGDDLADPLVQADPVAAVHARPDVPVLHDPAAGAADAHGAAADDRPSRRDGVDPGVVGRGDVDAEVEGPGLLPRAVARVVEVPADRVLPVERLQRPAVGVRRRCEHRGAEDDCGDATHSTHEPRQSTGVRPPARTHPVAHG